MTKIHSYKYKSLLPSQTQIQIHRLIHYLCYSIVLTQTASFLHLKPIFTPTGESITCVVEFYSPRQLPATISNQPSLPPTTCVAVLYSPRQLSANISNQLSLPPTTCVTVLYSPRQLPPTISNPTSHRHVHPPSMLLHVELAPQMSVVSWHSSTSEIKRRYSV